MASFDQAGLEIYSDWFLIRGTKAPLEPNKLSGVLLQLAPGATAQQLRFGILANLPSVKVVSGGSMLTSIRQGLAALLNGVLVLVAIIFVSTALMGACCSVDLGGSFKQKSGPLWRDRSRRLWGRVTADWELVTAAGLSRAS